MEREKNTGQYLLVLLTAFNPIKSAQFSQGEVRSRQYEQGFANLNKYFNKIHENNVKTILVDNTIASEKDIDEKIFQYIPTTAQIITCPDNHFGPINKGAGLIESWRYVSDIIEKHEWIIHFEPRQSLKSFYFLNSFFENPRNLFTLGPGGDHFNSGLWCMQSKQLINLINNIDLHQMTKKYISFEYILHYFTMKNIEDYDVLDKMDLIWHDTISNTAYHK